MIMPRADRINRTDRKNSLLASPMIHVSRMFRMIHTCRMVIMMFVSRTIPIIRMTPVSPENTAGSGEQGDAG
jgi:hypothetical protein